jgi:3-phenylpropionate/trans-cinnamate dioxygenase ferredoxin reductase subunit
VAAFEGDGSVRRVRTGSGEVVDCDFVIVGVGVSPRVGLAYDAGLDVDNGIVVDAQMRSSAPTVYAAGDVANAWHPFYGRRVRVEHWANALHQGPAAARAMLGEDFQYDQIPYFFSDQYEVGMEFSGDTSQSDQLIFRGRRESGEFIALWLYRGCVVAGMNVNVEDVNEHIQALIRSRRQVDPAALADADTPLETLVG